MLGGDGTRGRPSIAHGPGGLQPDSSQADSSQTRAKRNLAKRTLAKWTLAKQTLAKWTLAKRTLARLEPSLAPVLRASGSHNLSRLEPDSGLHSSRLECLGNRSLSGSNRSPRADTSLLAAGAGSDRGPRANSTLDSSPLAVSWQFLGGLSLA